MSDELRWILLAFGAVLIVGLWLWESIRSRRKPLAEDPFAVATPTAPAHGMGQGRHAAPTETLPAEPVWREPDWLAPEPDRFPVPEIPVDEPLPPLEPPVVEVPDNLSPEVTGSLPVITPEESAYDRPRTPAAAPTASPKPLPPERGAVREPVRPPPPAPAPRAAERPRPTRPPRQKILALRLVGNSASGRFQGATLRSTLEAEGLTFGRYHIFHRELSERQLVFSVASLIEPGSFEIESMDLQEFPGISLFAVLPGALPATEVFDELVACARRLASRLGGQLQDDRRAPLTAARVLEMRDEITVFENALLEDGDDAGG
ncbi:MAG: cell division protein ZipA C-terminal FtsZ-binding domain-containing protein [Gammaproteobacteria bacterium]